MINVPKVFEGHSHADNYSNMVGRHGAGRTRINYTLNVIYDEIASFWKIEKL